MEPWRLTASAALANIRVGDLTIQDYAISLLDRIKQRDDAVKAWVYLDPEYVLEQAKALDKMPMNQRGPLHGLPIAVKDVIYTKDMPTQYNSPLYKDDFPKVDAASIIILRDAGALIFGKTTTTEFAATTVGPATRNPHDLSRTPGGSSAGSAAAVADFQIPLALGTQTGGSIIRPASFTGIYGFKPTWNSISREGQKVYALILDTLGFHARCVDDLVLLADVFALQDDEESEFHGVQGAKFAVCKTMVWSSAGEGTKAALDKAASLLRAHGAIVEEIDLGPAFDNLLEWYRVTLQAEGRTAFLSEYRVGKEDIHDLLISHVENTENFTRKAQLKAFDGIAALRPKMDEIAGRYAAILTPSVPDQAPLGLENTGDAVFCSIWTVRVECQSGCPLLRQDIEIDIY
ncbi:hypothetical protein G7046_g2179 [Stylonectria norvegica]|nr:hypothetical protein G7046_g2179 [Stylonectria norvegica]